MVCADSRPFHVFLSSVNAYFLPHPVALTSTPSIILNRALLGEKLAAFSSHWTMRQDCAIAKLLPQSVAQSPCASVSDRQLPACVHSVQQTFQESWEPVA